MPFDWDGDGDIDELDIALSVSLLDDDDDNGEAPSQKVARNPGSGCLVAVISVIGIMAFALLWILI